jgi:hypothetical protein
MLYNFTKFVQWPAEALGSTAHPVTFCIFGANPFGSTLDELLQGKLALGRPARITHVEDVRELAACHIAFLSGSEERRTAEIVQTLGTASVLTVGDGERFLKLGTVMAFSVREGKVRFGVNTRAAETAALRVSSKLLKLAVTVASETPRDGT